MPSAPVRNRLTSKVSSKFLPMSDLSLLRPEMLANSARPVPQGRTYFVQTWGCQMNEEDSEQMGLYLEMIGYRPASGMHEASVVLLNTCSVRKKPEDKAFSLLGVLADLKKARPELI